METQDGTPEVAPVRVVDTEVGAETIAAMVKRLAAGRRAMRQVEALRQAFANRPHDLVGSGGQDQ